MRLSALTASAALLACLAGPAAADESQLWSSVTVTGKLAGSERWGYSANTELRFTDDGSNPHSAVLRGALTYRMDGGVRLGAGLARFHDGGLFTDAREDRLWQEISYPVLSLGGGEVSGRTRLEQRMLTADRDTGWRLRQRFRYTHPLSENTSLAVWNEVFWTLNDTASGPASGFDQNRLGASLGWQATETVSFETGYVQIGLHRDESLFSETRHILLLSMSLSL